MSRSVAAGAAIRDRNVDSSGGVWVYAAAAGCRFSRDPALRSILFGHNCGAGVMAGQLMAPCPERAMQCGHMHFLVSAADLRSLAPQCC